jgi:hypothetical protein
MTVAELLQIGSDLKMYEFVQERLRAGKSPDNIARDLLCKVAGRVKARKCDSVHRDFVLEQIRNAGSFGA